MSLTYAPNTVSGIVTSWLPLTTAYPITTECFSSFLAHGDVMSAGIYIYVFDVTYGISVDPNLNCLPSAVTTWWNQLELHDGATSYGLGPIVCPQAYTTVLIVPESPGTSLVGCCPSGYTLENAGTLMSAPFPGQCRSSMPANQVFTYASPVSNSSIWTTTTAVLPTATDIWALQVNGYILPGYPSLTTGPAVTETGASQNPPDSNTGQISYNSAPVTGAGVSSGLSSGAKIGIGIGVAALVVGIACLVGMRMIWTRNKQSKRFASSTLMTADRTAEQHLFLPGGFEENKNGGTAQEMPGLREHAVHELDSRQQSSE